MLPGEFFLSIVVLIISARGLINYFFARKEEMITRMIQKGERNG